MTPQQREAVREMRERLQAEKGRLLRLVDATDDGDLDDATQSLEDTMECLDAALDNDEEWKNL